MMVDCFDAMVMNVGRHSTTPHEGIYVDAFQVEDTQACRGNFSEDGVPVRYVLTSSAPVLIPRLTNTMTERQHTEEKGSSRQKRYATVLKFIVQ